MAKKVHLSPGTYVSEKDLTFSVEALGVTTLGLVGETLKGPAFQPLFIRNYDEYKTLFGGTSPEKFRNSQIPKYELPYIAKSYLTQSNQLYVTRVLGLSGYDKGLAYALKTIGSIDTTSIVHGSTTITNVDFKYDTATASAVPQYIDGSNNVLSTLAARISALTGVAESKFDAAFATFFNKTNYTTKNWHKGDILHWGVVSATDLNNFVTGSTANTSNATPITVDGYELPSDVPSGDRNAHVFQNEFVYNSGSNNFQGTSFAIYTYGFTNIGGGVIKGICKVIAAPATGTPITES